LASGADRGVGRLREDRRIAGHQHHRAFRLLQRGPGRDGEAARAVQLERQAGLPLLVCHLEQVDLRHGAGDIEQRVDSAEGLQGLIDHRLGGRRLGQIDIDDQRFRASGLTASAVCSRLARFRATRPAPRNRGRDGSPSIDRYPGWPL
jgi:hypothetical protein